MQDLKDLVRQAVQLGGGDLCHDQHAWESIGGRPCPTQNPNCSQIVYRCARCGEYDYGYKENSPGLKECRQACGNDLQGWKRRYFNSTDVK